MSQQKLPGLISPGWVFLIGLLLLIIGGVSGWLTTVAVAGPGARQNDPASVAIRPQVAAMIAQVDQKQIETDIANLQDDDADPGWDALQSRYTLHPGRAVEAAYLYQELARLGLSVTDDPFTMTVASRTYTPTNVVATLPGSDPTSQRRYLITAHYDSTAARTPNWDWRTGPAPGADDNASGTAGVLAAARVLSHYRFRHTVQFVLFAGEEQGMFGSAHFARQARLADQEIAAVINLDMIGYNPICNKVDIVGNEASDWLVNAISEATVTYNLPFSMTRQAIDSSFWYSDHSSFWNNGYAAVLLIEDFQLRTGPCYQTNASYHTINDTLDRLNRFQIAQVTRLVVGVIAQWADPRPLFFLPFITLSS